MPEPPRRAAVERLLPLEAIADASVAELQQASDVLRALLEADGLLDVGGQRSVFEVGYRELAAVAGVFGTVERLWRERPDLPRLIDVLKVADPEHVRWCLQVLAWAGLVVVDPPPE
jgi:hypothetical protein